MSRTVVVTGATGNIAGRTVPQLVSAGLKVRVLARDPAKASKLAGVEVVQGDLDVPSTLSRVFDGADAVFLVVPNGPRSAQHVSSALWEARKAGVKHILRLSAVGAATDAPTINSRLHALSDYELSASGVPFTVIKPHFFMQNLMGHAQTVATQGAMYAALGQGRFGMIDSQDIADVAAAILVRPESHLGQTYTITGPASISMDDVAAAFSAALGKPVKYVPVSLAQADEGMKGWGMDGYMRSMMADYLAAYASGWGDFATEDVARITGHSPRSVADFAKAVAPAFTAR